MFLPEYGELPAAGHKVMWTWWAMAGGEKYLSWQLCEASMATVGINRYSVHYNINTNTHRGGGCMNMKLKQVDALTHCLAEDCILPLTWYRRVKYLC